MVASRLLNLLTPPFKRVAVAKIINAKVFESLDHGCAAVRRKGDYMGDHTAVGEGLWRLTEHIHKAGFPSILGTVALFYDTKTQARDACGGD